MTSERVIVDEAGMRAARAVAGWYLGHPSWAEKIIGAYLYPEETMKNLAIERGDEVGGRINA